MRCVIKGLHCIYHSIGPTWWAGKYREFMSPSLCVQCILQIYEAGTEAPYECVTKINFLIYEPNHLLLVLKRTVKEQSQWDGSFMHPKQMLIKTNG